MANLSPSFVTVTPPPILALDNFPTAKFAFSTRKLRSNYSGSAYRVRRSSDNAEQDIGFSGNDADVAAMATFVGANTGSIVVWYDQAGSNNLTPLATLGPEVRSASTNRTLNSMPAAYFTGSDLRTGNTSISVVPSGNPIHYLAVVSVDNFTDYRTIVCVPAGGGGNGFHWYTVITTGILGTSNQLVGIGDSSSAISAATKALVEFKYDGTNWAHFLNSSANGSGSNAQTVTQTFVFGGQAGNVFPMVGYMPEIIAYEVLGDLDSGQLSLLRQNMKTYWGTP